MTERCGFTWVPEEQNNTDSCAYCCYRSTWKEFDRCVWHTKTDLRKPSDALDETREQPENRKLNRSPRELLSGAVLRNAELTDRVLTRVDFSGSDFQNANLEDVYLRYSNFSDSDIRGADLTNCTVSRVSFRNANLRNADLRRLSIYGVDFTGAELSKADFRKANVRNTDLTGANPEAAKGLVDTEITQNTESKHSPDTRKRTDRDPGQSEDSNVDSTTEFQDNSKEATSSDGDDQQEVLTPRELPVPDPEEYTVSDGSTIYPNYLSEYYESFRSARRVLELVFQMHGTDIDPEDLRDPRVQYFVLLDAFVGFGDVSTPFTGYGPQHRNRLSFSITDYRKVFGDAETVTDYQVIDVNPFRENTHELLREMASVKTTKEFVRPCVPGTNHPIPELPGSLAELQDALRQLATFPAYPPLPSENGTNNRTIPIADIYRTCFRDLDQEYRVDLTPLEATESQPTGPVPAATPTSSTEFESKLIDYGRLSHLFRRVKPPAGSPVTRVLDIFALDWYRPSSPTFDALQALAKHGKDDPMDTFRPRLQDLIHRRFLLDTWDYDYITVYPGHEAGSRSSQLVELAQDAVLKTDIIYTPLLERTETVERQREKSEEERRQVALHPSDSLRTRAKLNDDTVILFDDICTTGSSLLAGAHLLRQAGADRVVCITLGLTPGGSQTNVKEVTDPEAPASEIIAGVD